MAETSSLDSCLVNVTTVIAQVWIHKLQPDIPVRQYVFLTRYTWLCVLISFSTSSPLSSSPPTLTAAAQTDTQRQDF